MKLKPAKNVRRVIRNCGHCKFGELGDGVFRCKRKYGFVCDSGDFLWWSMVCDRFKELSHEELKF